MENKITLANQKEQELQQRQEQILLKDDYGAQNQLKELILQCYDTLRTFGKEPEQLANMTAVFQKMLGKYPYGDVENGFLKYMERHSDMPAPADIINIIDPLKIDYSGVMYEK